MTNLALLTCLFMAPAPEAVAPDTVVVCPQPLLKALEPWIIHRQRQGHQLALVADPSNAEKTRAAIRLAAKGGKLKFVVLVGDSEPTAKDDKSVRARHVPTHMVKAKVNVLWGSEKELATDNYYADLDDDGVPDVALGRLSADTPEQLKIIVQKTIAYEESRDFTAWRRQVNFVAGVGGFGLIADSVLEMTTKKFITDGVPSEFQTSMTYGSWRSPYCPDPRRFHQTTLSRLNEGCLFWVYIGHGQRRWLDRVIVPGGHFHILATQDVPQMKAAAGAPIAVFLSCYTGAYDEPKDCLAEEMLRQPNGPVAALCGSRVTMPYGLAVLADRMLHECFQNKRPTLGEVVLHAKRGAVGKPQGGTRQMLDMLAGVLSPDAKLLPDERAEHVQLMNLIGDPLLRLHHPKSVDLVVPEYATTGRKIEVTGSSPLAGKATVELICRRDRLTFKPTGRPKFVASDAALNKLQHTYQRANDPRFSSHTIDLTGGKFATTIDVPVECLGHCHVRVYVKGSSDFAIGAKDVYVRAPQVEPTTPSASPTLGRSSLQTTPSPR